MSLMGSTYHHSILWRFFLNIVFTVRSKSETVSSIGILGACHLPEKILIDLHYYMHLPPLNSVEVLRCSVRFVKIVCIISSKSDSVSSIRILGACHLLGKTLIDVLDE